MNTLPKRRKKPRRKDMNRVPAHLQWIRGHECLVCDQDCNGGIEAAHVRTGTGGGMGMKPHDKWTVPLCTRHHAVQHAMGEVPFQEMHKVDMKSVAAKLWLISPAGKKYRAEMADV